MMDWQPIAAVWGMPLGNADTSCTLTAQTDDLGALMTKLAFFLVSCMPVLHQLVLIYCEVLQVG